MPPVLPHVTIQAAIAAGVPVPSHYIAWEPACRGHAIAAVLRPDHVAAPVYFAELAKLANKATN